MRTSVVFPASSLSLVLLVGCVVPALNTKEPSAEAVSTRSPSVEEISHRFYYWNEEAMELREMAERREREADVLSKNKEESSAELVTGMRTLAKQLHAAAEYADEQAQQAQRQVRQGMTQ